MESVARINVDFAPHIPKSGRIGQADLGLGIPPPVEQAGSDGDPQFPSKCGGECGRGIGAPSNPPPEMHWHWHDRVRRGRLQFAAQPFSNQLAEGVSDTFAAVGLHAQALLAEQMVVVAKSQRTIEPQLLTAAVSALRDDPWDLGHAGSTPLAHGPIASLHFGSAVVAVANAINDLVEFRIAGQAVRGKQQIDGTVGNAFQPMTTSDGHGDSLQSGEPKLYRKIAVLPTTCLDASRLEFYSPRPETTDPSPFMKLLDRYLLRQFVQIFVICFLSLMGLYLVIDLFGHLDNFSQQAEREGSLLQVIGKYYGYQSIGFFDRTSGILAMISAMFTVTWLQRHQEMTAMLAAGISKFRIIRPLILAAVVVSLMGVASRELLIPEIREELTRSTKDLGGTEARTLEARFDGRTDILIGGEQTIALERKIIKPTFILPRALKQYGNQLVAREAIYLEATEFHPPGYLMLDVSTPSRIDRRKSLHLNGREVVLTARQEPWLEPGQAFVVSDLPFEMLANGTAWRSYASTGELIEELNRPSADLGPDVRVAVHSRIVQPVSDTTLLMLGLPLMFSRRQRNIFLSIGICFSVAIAFTLATVACQSLGGISLLRPTLAAWLPIMVFLPVAVGMSHSLRT